MKNLKMFFKTFEKLLVCGIQRRIAGSYKFFAFHPNPIVLAAIFIPCLLQFPVISFGQDGANIVNSGLVTAESNRESIHSIKVITDGGNFRSEGGFEDGDSSSNLSSFAPPVGKPVDGNITKKDNHKANKSEDSFSFQDDDFWLLYLLLFLFAGFLIAHSGNEEG